MDKYAIYTYELSRGRITEGNIIDGPQVVTPGIEHAYENFERIFGDKNNKMTLRYKNQKGEDASSPCYVKAHDLGVVLLRVDKLKNVYVYEEEWAGPIPEIKKRGHESHPNCHVIIDNREDFHQIAIEIEPAAWRDTRKVRDILQAGLNEELKRFGLVISIQAKTMPEDYWQLTQRKRKKEHKALRKLTIGFDTSKMTSQAQHIINKSMRIKSLMTLIDYIGGGKGILDLQSFPGTDELLRKKLADIKHIVELCGENTYWLALTFSDGVTYRCGENVRAELPMNPSTVRDHFAKGEGYLDLCSQGVCPSVSRLLFCTTDLLWVVLSFPNDLFDIHKWERYRGRILKMEAADDEGNMWTNEDNRALPRARAGMNLLTPGTPNCLAEERWFHA